MGRITPVIDDGLEKRLRDYISSTREKAYGGITEVVEEAITNFLDNKLLRKHCKTIDLSIEEARKAITIYLESRAKETVFLDQKETQK